MSLFNTQQYAESSSVSALETSYCGIEAQISHRKSVKINSPGELIRYRLFKRGFDIGFVLFFSPLLLLICGLISGILLVDCPGPVLFSHRRLRRDGMYFEMWKFSTLCCASDRVLGEYLSRNPEAQIE